MGFKTATTTSAGHDGRSSNSMRITGDAAVVDAPIKPASCIIVYVVIHIIILACAPQKCVRHAPHNWQIGDEFFGAI